MIYQSLNYLIDDQALTIHAPSGERLTIRPKTCQLLVLLLNHAGQAVSKQQLLESIWQGTVVSDQVIFQSINEIRQLFSEDVIKTIPKQGYIWLPTVTKEVTQALDSSNPKTKNSFTLALFGFAISCVFLLYLMFKQDVEPIKGSVVILPINNKIQGNDHNWIRYGMMDQIIQSLPNSSTSLVLQTDYVFNVLKRANASVSDISAKDIQQIFQVSGAEFIVEATLAGAPHDYQLNYAFHDKKGTKKGALIDKDLQTLITQLTSTISKQLGNTRSFEQQVYVADFNNELLANALEKRLNGRYAEALTLLKVIANNDPSNITARRTMIETLFRLKQFEKAFEEINSALPIAEQQNDLDETTRLLYSKALYYYVTKNDHKAIQTANTAFNIASQNQDWLLMAYIRNVQAISEMNNENFELAKQYLIDEKTYQQVLRCPVGEASAWASIAKLAKEQNAPDDFTFAIDNALSITKERGLDSQFQRYRTLKENHFNQ